jgi:predicted aspartyl protease
MWGQPLGSVSIPFEYPRSRVWVRARVMQREAFGILDTGADGTAIDSVFASKVGLETKGMEKGTVEADELELTKAGPASFDLGPAKLEAEGVYVVPLASRVPGLVIIGFDTMRKVPFTLDYSSKTLELGPRKGREVPFALEKDLRPSVPAEILGERFSGVLDTGSGTGISLPLQWVEKNASRLKVDLGPRSERTLLGEGKLRSRGFVLGRLILAEIALEDVKAEGVESEKGSASDQETNWASVGNLVLGKLGWVGFDGRRRRMVLPPNPGEVI